MQMTRSGRRAWGWAVAVLFCLAAAAPVAAQTTSATVSGTVVDSQGGVLPGASVTLTSRTQGNTLTRIADAEGRFVFPIVRPDSYTLRVTLQGFKTLERPNVVVNANDRFSAGTLALSVGEMSEEVSVMSRVSELQAESGERSFTLESEALKNIANDGRSLFNFATLVPGVLSQNTGNAPLGQVSSFTANGQRPNSNNMTIDGVANIDTGDNGGNMATTNIDAVAEFKILTNAYQAEYGRAVGGQVQVVTKSGTQSFHGSGYWYGRRGQLERQQLDEQPRRDRQEHGVRPQRLRLHHRRSALHPGRLQQGQEEALLLLQPGVPAEDGLGEPAAEPRSHGPRAPGGLLPERRQQRQPLPLHPRLYDRAALQRVRHQGLLPGRRRPGAHPPGSALSAGDQRPQHLPRPELLGGERHQLPEPDSRLRPPARGPVETGLPGQRQLALHGPLHEGQGRERAGLRHDLGRRRAATTSPCRSLIRFPARTGWSAPPASSIPRRRSR